MFWRGQTQEPAAVRAGLRMVEAQVHRPLTPQVQVTVGDFSKKGARLLLTTPFLGDCHILMDVHNITPKLAEVSLHLPGQDGGQEDLTLLGQIVAYDQCSGPGEFRFWVELAWVEQPEGDAGRQRAVRQITKAVRRGRRGEAS